MPDFVTVAVFTFPHEMSVHRALLEWEGIECVAKDENIVSTHPFYSHAVGGVKLQVHQADLDRARELLIGSGALVEPEAEPGPTVDRFAEKLKGARLPKFPSLSPERARTLMWILIGGAAVALVLFM